MPSVQLVHLVLPWICEKVPRAQSTHTVALLARMAVENLPGRQVVQALEDELVA